MLVLAACGSSSGSGSGSSTGGAQASSGPSTTAPVSTGGYNPVSNYAQYVGGSGAADNSKSPIYIGVTNEQGGSAAIAPQWTNGTQLAADFINAEAGGIGGHPLKLTTCFIPDVVANAAQCGQQFANDSNIQSIAMGAVAVGNQALENALAPTGKPIAFGVAISPIDTTYKNGYILFGDATHVEAPIGTFVAQYLKSKSVAIVYPNLPGSDVPNKIIAASLAYEHIPYKIVAFDPNSSNLTAPLIASGAATAGLVMNGAASPQLCSSVYLALKQLNIKTPVLANVPCDTGLTAQGDGGQLPVGWYYASANPLPGDPADPSLAAFKAVADKYGQSKYDDDPWTADAFAQVLTIAKVYNGILSSGGTINADSVNAGFKALKGPIPQGAPSLVCGSFASAPAVCNDKVSFFQNTSPGVFKAIARWIGPPDGFVPPAGLE